MLATLAAVLVLTFFLRQIDHRAEVALLEQSRSLQVLGHWREALANSRQYATDWVFQPSNTDSRAALRQWQQTDYQSLKLEIVKVAATWPDTSQVKQLRNLLLDTDTLLRWHQQLTEKLGQPEAYDKPANLAQATQLLNTRIGPTTHRLLALTQLLRQTKQTEFNQNRQGLLNDIANLRRLIFIALAFTALAIVVILVVAGQSVIAAFGKINDSLRELSLGRPGALLQPRFQDEMGQAMLMVNQVNQVYAQATGFAQQIGQGNYNAPYATASERDELGTALLQMRDSLKQAAHEADQRNWANEGAAKFANILRTNSQSQERLAVQLLTELVQYVGANQGSLFILNDTLADDVHLELVAAYAWDKRRFVDKKVYPGDGTVGQAWLEQDTLFITDVPNHYVQIGSGLGDANPNCLVVVPLIFNAQVYGVLELASFAVMKPHQLEFLKKFAETVASAIATVKVNERTHKLLAASQEMAEQLRMQEEEMRQNLEELMATQDELQRKATNYERQVEEHLATIERLQSRKKVLQ
ncbi:MAG: GAF domain-containing protein [Bernardetiaceae bacterium]|nr:GAF domain-containing protein [Bernardetiaceae bacterium]